MFVRSLSIGVAAAALLAGGAQAADLIIPTTPQPIYEAAGFDWEGMYAGVRAGGVFMDEEDTSGVVGGVVGINFMPADAFLAGVEVTGDYVWGDDSEDRGEFFANVRAGAVVTDAALVYAIAGVGVDATEDDDSHALYQLGGGVEFMATDTVSVRGEVVGIGQFDADGGDDYFFENAKATVGVFYHF